MSVKQIQLHKAGDTGEKWMPKTHSNCVEIQGLAIQDAIMKNDRPLNDVLKDFENLIGGKIDQNSVLFKYRTSTSGSYTNVRLGNEITIQGGGGSGDITGSGTNNRIAKFNGAKTITNSIMMDDGSSITVSGDIYATGGVTCAASSSDKRLKTDIKPFSGLGMIGNLNFVQFKWNDTAVELNKDYFDKEATNYGVIAQDAEGVIDGLVFDMPSGYKGVKYEKLIPIMAQAIKELENEVKELKQQLKK